MPYAIISLGGKQYRVSECEQPLVDRLAEYAGATRTLDPLLVGGDGDPQLGSAGVTVTARVVGHVLGKKIRIGKYRPKQGYRRHTGFRSRLSQIQIESIGPAGGRGQPTASVTADDQAAVDESATADETTES